MRTAARIITALLALPFLVVALEGQSTSAVAASNFALILLLPNLIALGIGWARSQSLPDDTPPQ